MPLKEAAARIKDDATRRWADRLAHELSQMTEAHGLLQDRVLLLETVLKLVCHNIDAGRPIQTTALIAELQLEGVAVEL